MSGFGKLIVEIAIVKSLVWVFDGIENYNGDSYYCPSYCEADHKHDFLDLQSDMIVENDEIHKSRKNKDLASK